MRLEKLSELLDISIGRTPSRNEPDYWGKGHRWVSIRDLSSKTVTETKEQITDRAVKEARCKIVKKGTLLFSFKLTIGKMAFADCDLFTNEAIAAFAIKDERNLNSEFLYYALQSATYGGSNQAVMGKTLNSKSLAEIEIPLPPLDDQIRIAHLLGKVEGLIAQRKQHLQQLDDLLKSVFLEMFGDPVRNEKGWDTKALPELCIKITDGEHLNPQFSPSGMPMAMAGNVLDHTVSFRDAKFVEYGLGASFRKKCNPELSDILLVSRGATIGRLCRVDTSEPFCLMGSVILLKPIHMTVSSTFLVAQLKHPALYWKLFRSSGSSAQQAIYLKDVKRLVCILPPKELQLKFADFSEKVESTKDSYSRSLNDLEALYGALSQQAFKGELDLSRVPLQKESAA